MLLKGVATSPARERTLKLKTGASAGQTRTVWEIAVLDEDGGVVTVTTWLGKNLWPDAKVGTPVTAKVGRARMYLGQTQVSIAGEPQSE